MPEIPVSNTETKAPKMWEAIYHDPEKDRMFLWYMDGTMDVLQNINTFYTNIRGQFGAKPCGMHDIYGNEMFAVQRHTKDEREIRHQFSGPRNHLAEIDIDPRARFLSRFYANAGMLKADMSKINLCFLDIEVETTGKFPRASVAAYPINCVTIYFSKTDNYITYGVAKDVSQEVKDEMAKDNGRYVLCKTEGELLTRLFTEIGNNNVSILSGWNFTYDTTYMVNRAAKLKIPLKLMSRLPAAEKRAWVDQREGDLCNQSTNRQSKDERNNDTGRTPDLNGQHRGAPLQRDAETPRQLCETCEGRLL